MKYAKRSPRMTTGALLVAATMVTGAVLISPPANFPAHHIVAIKSGMSLTEIASYLKEHAVIRSKVAFETMAMLFGGDRTSRAGAYYFNDAGSVFTIAYRLSHGVFGVDPIKVTIPEGSTVSDIADTLAKDIPDFDKEAFLAKANPLEGYLFPDTYFFLPTVTPDDVISQMRATFDKREKEIATIVSGSGHSLADIVTMASILEKEAHTLDDRRIISGILWKRIKIGMPLQVDATFLYINGKNTYQLTADDLAVDSPYNTYKNKGLPPGPIDSPSLDSLRAAADPEPTPYLFYLSDRKGNLYYAEDFKEHVRNKIKYLN